MLELGQLEGEKCNRNNCDGIIKMEQVENCSCHLHPPCGACMSVSEFCPVCDWYASEEPKEKPFVFECCVNNITATTPLDDRQINWRYERHTHFSMKKVGVFPKGTTQEQVRKVVDGTFGGIFESWNSEARTFSFIAYTD